MISDILLVRLDFIRHMIKHFRSLQSPQKCCILLPRESANHIGGNSNSQNMKLTGGGGFRGGIAVDQIIRLYHKIYKCMTNTTSSKLIAIKKTRSIQINALHNCFHVTLISLIHLILFPPHVHNKVLWCKINFCVSFISANFNCNFRVLRSNNKSQAHIQQQYYHFSLNRIL